MPEYAWTCHDFALTLSNRNGIGDRERALSLLQDALKISTDLGMHPLTEKVGALEDELLRPKYTREDTPEFPSGLSKREVEVLRLVSAGKTNKEIAEELTISVFTVAHHMTNILAKTDSSNRAEAAAYAIRRSL